METARGAYKSGKKWKWRISFAQVVSGQVPTSSPNPPVVNTSAPRALPSGNSRKKGEKKKEAVKASKEQSKTSAPSNTASSIPVPPSNKQEKNKNKKTSKGTRDVDNNKKKSAVPTGPASPTVPLPSKKNKRTTYKQGSQDHHKKSSKPKQRTNLNLGSSAAQPPILTGHNKAVRTQNLPGSSSANPLTSRKQIPNPSAPNPKTAASASLRPPGNCVPHDFGTSKKTKKVFTHTVHPAKVFNLYYSIPEYQDRPRKGVDVFDITPSVVEVKSSLRYAVHKPPDSYVFPNSYGYPIVRCPPRTLNMSRFDKQLRNKNHMNW